MTLEFNTPTGQKRDPQSIEVDFCGDHIHADRPKAWGLSNAETVFAERVPNRDRAIAILGYMDSVLDESAYQRFIDRTLDRDDPLDLTAVFEFIRETRERWENYDSRTNTPITISASESGNRLPNKPVPVTNDDADLNLSLVAPKDVAMMVFFAIAASNTDTGQRWAVEYFLEATCSREDFLLLKRRLNAKHDVLDIEHLDSFFADAIDSWTDGIDLAPDAPASNRAQRRAAGRAG